MLEASSITGVVVSRYIKFTHARKMLEMNESCEKYIIMFHVGYITYSLIIVIGKIIWHGPHGLDEMDLYCSGQKHDHDNHIGATILLIVTNLPHYVIMYVLHLRMKHKKATLRPNNVQEIRFMLNDQRHTLVTISFIIIHAVSWEPINMLALIRLHSNATNKYLEMFLILLTFLPLLANPVAVMCSFTDVNWSTEQMRYNSLNKMFRRKSFSRRHCRGEGDLINLQGVLREHYRGANINEKHRGGLVDRTMRHYNSTTL